jgi:hypothetical protein
VPERINERDNFQITVAAIRLCEIVTAKDTEIVAEIVAAISLRRTA